MGSEPILGCASCIRTFFTVISIRKAGCPVLRSALKHNDFDGALATDDQSLKFLTPLPEPFRCHHRGRLDTRSFWAARDEGGRDRNSLVCAQHVPKQEGYVEGAMHRSLQADVECLVPAPNPASILIKISVLVLHPPSTGADVHV